jgi:hypothetical protein
MAPARVSQVGLVYDIETIARRLKASVTRMWATLTTPEAANASEAHYRATSAMMAADRDRQGTEEGAGGETGSGAATRRRLPLRPLNAVSSVNVV